MSLECLKRTKIPVPYSILSLDAEWKTNYKDAYVWAVCGRLWNKKKNQFDIIDKVFFDRKDVFNYLFNKEWQHTILTGFNSWGVNEEKEIVYESKLTNITALISVLEDNARKFIRIQTPVGSNFF